VPFAATDLLAWYDRHRRSLPWRAKPGQVADPYHVWLSEIMLQQTTTVTVGPYFETFLGRWPTVAALAAAPLDDVLRVWAGPRDDWFEPAALLALTAANYQVTPTSNRTGLRLSGAALVRARAGELPTEGMVTGALQVPPDGQPILLLADHQTTGGYPVIAVVHSADIGRAAQLRPGRLVRFQLVLPGT